MGIAYIIGVNKMIKGYEISNDKLKLSESMTNSASSHTIGTLWFLEVSSILFVIIGITFVISSPDNWFIGLLGILFFGAGGYVFWQMIKAKKGIKPFASLSNNCSSIPPIKADGAELTIDLTCPKCGEKYEHGMNFCKFDGTKLVSATKLISTCSKCGRKFENGARFCPDDGGAVVPKSSR